jgi:hemolysin activation/secretion protein
VQKYCKAAACRAANHALPGLVLMAALAGAALSAQAQVAAASAPPAPALSVPVTRFDVQGNTLLPPTRLAQRLDSFTGTATLDRLRAAAAAVQELYRDAGYGGVVAFLPEQDLKDGVVKIRVVEGKLVRVDVSDNKRFSTANIRASLPSLVTGVTPNVKRIDAEIQIANENPSKTVQVLLQPGAKAGDVVAAITVAEQAEQRVTGRLDNTGGKQIGRWRAALGWQHANVWGLDHVFAAELQTAPQDTSAVKVISGNYRAPLYGQALAFDAYGAWSNVDAGKVDTAAGDLSFSGKGTIFGARLSAYLPRSANVDQRAALGLESREYKNNCSIAGLPQGACGSAGASVSLQPLSLTYTAQAASETRWGLSLGLHTNLGAGGSHGSQADFDAVRSGAQRRYLLLRGSGQVSVPIGDTLAFTSRVNLQAAGKPLVPGEMFGAGGAQSVRG